MDTRDLGPIDAEWRTDVSGDAEDWVILFPPAQARLYLNATLLFDSTSPPPRRWYRFWQRVLLGWRWEEVDG